MSSLPNCGALPGAASGERPNAPPAHRRRRLFLLVSLSGCLLVCLLLGWYGWRRGTTPAPPDVSLEGVDPALARAIATARRQVIAEPRSAAAWGRLGKLLLAARYNEAAATCFGQAAGLDAADPHWPYLWADALLPQDPDAALPLLRRAVEWCDRTDPANSAPRLRLAETLLALGRLEEAEGPLRRVLESEPDNPRAHLDLGLLAYDREDLESSRTHLERCRESPWTRQKACSRLAAIHQRLGNSPKAAEYSRQAAAPPADRPWEDPYLREARRPAQVGAGRARVAEALEAAGRYAEAAAVLRDMMQESPEYGTAIGLGKNLFLLEDYAGAEQALRHAVALAPDKAQAHYWLSKLYLVRGEKQRPGASAEDLYRAAVQSARAAIARKPDHALAHLCLGLALKKLGRRAEAIDVLRAAVQYSPDSADLYLHLGESLAEDGRRSEARMQLERAVQLARPDDPRPGAALARLAAAEKKTR
jgi:tetratricopeptide (TPR) repeat protein